MEYFKTDLEGFIKNPKETFRRILTYEGLKTPMILLIICGVIMGIKRFLSADVTLIDVLPAEQTPYRWGLRDADYVMAFLIPIFVIVFWFVCSFLLDIVAEKMGAIKGELGDMLIASGYLSVPTLAFLIIDVLLFFFGKVARVPILGTLDDILCVLFLLWFLFLLTQMLEVVSEIPMSHAVITIIITLGIYMFVYYGIVEMLIKSVMANAFAAKHMQ
jgi:hypothetical protein